MLHHVAVGLWLFHTVSNTILIMLNHFDLEMAQVRAWRRCWGPTPDCWMLRRCGAGDAGDEWIRCGSWGGKFHSSWSSSGPGGVSASLDTCSVSLTFIKTYQSQSHPNTFLIHESFAPVEIALLCIAMHCSWLLLSGPDFTMLFGHVHRGPNAKQARLWTSVAHGTV